MTARDPDFPTPRLSFKVTISVMHRARCPCRESPGKLLFLGRSILAISRAMTRLWTIGIPFFLLLAGCHAVARLSTPTQSGFNTNNLVDANAQAEGDELGDTKAWFTAAEEIRSKRNGKDPNRPRKSVLCLSGGGSFGAFTAGVLNGWTQTGTRPNFDVVTGISTGALIAPLAFLGSEYDETIKRFYTDIDQRDIYHLRPIRGLFTNALADNGPLEKKIRSVVNEDLIAKIAVEHAKGRRLYIGTTELEGHRFVYWDIGAIASRGGLACDRELIIKVLLGSSAIPGFFPPARIPVTIDGQPFEELHGDGGVSQAIFFRPPYLPPDQRMNAAEDFASTDLYMIVAGKLNADAQPQKELSLTLAGTSVNAVLFAQARGDLQRMYLISVITGMNYNLCAMPAEFPAPTSSATFNRAEMNAMFAEGVRVATCGKGWRKSPPGVEFGETALKRQNTELTHQYRGPSLVVPRKGFGQSRVSPGTMPFPITPEALIK